MRNDIPSGTTFWLAKVDLEINGGCGFEQAIETGVSATCSGLQTHQETSLLMRLKDDNDSRQKRLFTGSEILKPGKDLTKPVTCFCITDLTFPVFLSLKFGRRPFIGAAWGNHRAVSADEGFFLPAMEQTCRFHCPEFEDALFSRRIDERQAKVWPNRLQSRISPFIRTTSF